MAETPAPITASWRRRHWRPLTLLTLIFLPAALFTGWSWVTLTFAYSRGDRAGYVQKLSEKGWVCKTWEGELAMANLPGAMPQIFRFSVRNDSIAKLVEQNLGKRVSLSYAEHRGIPTSCFGETDYFITNVRLTEP